MGHVECGLGPEVRYCWRELEYAWAVAVKEEAQGLKENMEETCEWILRRNHEKETVFLEK